MTKLAYSMVLLLAMALATPAVAAAPNDAAEAGQTAAADAQGETGDDHGAHDAPPLLSVNLGAAIWNLIIFLVVVALLGKFVWPQILAGLRGREEKIAHDLAEAEKRHAEAKRMLADYERKLADAQAESRKMLDQAREDAEKLKARLASETETEMQRLRERATQEINLAKQQALQELYATGAELATAVAGKILQRQIQPEDTDRLVRQSLEELENRQAS
jgi:F-type H+-transporting ATPase subunit b